MPQNAEQGLGRSAGAQHSSSDDQYLPQHLTCPSTAFWTPQVSQPCGTAPTASAPRSLPSHSHCH